MLTFRMDETNFDQGTRDGLRLVTGAGLKVDFDELGAGTNTLGLWHLHDAACQGEGTGLTDASGNGHDLTNHGAEAVEDGFRLDDGDADYLEAAFPGEPDRPQLTLETWVRQWQTPAGASGAIVTHRADDTHLLHLVARRDGANPSESHIAARLRIGGPNPGDATWSGADVDALLAGSEPWHAAAVLDAPNHLRLFVNGVLRAEDTVGIVPLPAADAALWLGRYRLGYTFHPTCVLDEVRLSAAARYTAAFTPNRLLEAGTLTSPTFDAARHQADWLDLTATVAIPDGCALAWSLRGADTLDAFGAPQAPWQPWDGDPANLPDARYLQWRAVLAASASRYESPTLTSAEATASEAGYNLYQATGSGPDTIDYADPWQRVGPGAREAVTGALAAGAVHWFGVRPVDADGRESPVTQGEGRLELDDAGQAVPDRPAAPLAPAAKPLPEGRARLLWRYRTGAVVPQAFRIYGDGGTGTINYETPLGEVPFRTGQAAYAWTSGTLEPGIAQDLAVRAVAADDVWDETPAVAAVTPDATPPAPVDALTAEVLP